MEKNNIHKKSINNGISAYLMIFISSLFLLNKKNEYVNNSFVKSHTKVALLIHFSFFIIYLIFIEFSFLKYISIYGYNLNYIIASSIFSILFIILLYGVYRASKGETFKIGEILKVGNIGKIENIIDINQNGKISEKDKLTLILSYIPFIGYYIYGKYYKSKLINKIVKLNLIISIIISLIYISGNKNITLLFILFYIIFAVFSGINIVINNKIIGINTNKIPSFYEIINYTKVLFKYLKNYFTKKEFVSIKQLNKNLLEKQKLEEEKNNQELKKLQKSKIPNILIYFPFINLINLFLKKSNKKIHIINGIMITIFFIIFIILNKFYYINNSSFIILLFPISFGLGYINYRPAYKMPIVYDLYDFLVSIKNIFIRTKKIIKKKKEEVHEETIKVGEIKK